MTALKLMQSLIRLAGAWLLGCARLPFEKSPLNWKIPHEPPSYTSRIPHRQG